MLKNFTVFLISNDNFIFWEEVLGVGDNNNGLSPPELLQSSNIISKNTKNLVSFQQCFFHIYIKCKTLKLTQDDTHSYLLP